MNLEYLLGQLKTSPEYARGLKALADNARPLWIEGLAGTAKAYVTAAMARDLERVALVITASEDAAEQLVENLPAFGFPPTAIGLYPATEPDLVESLGADKLLASSERTEQRSLARTRLAVLEALAAGELRIVIAPVQAALRATIGSIKDYRLELRKGGRLDLDTVARRLAEFGYERVPLVEVAGQFAIRGGLIDVFPSTRTHPVRIELFDDEIEQIREFEPESQRSTAALEAVTLVPASEMLETPGSLSHTHTILDHLPAGALVVLDEPNHMRSQWQEFYTRLKQREERAQESDKVLREHVTGVARAEFLELEAFLKRLEPFRLGLFTLLAHSLPWLRAYTEIAERASLNSGPIDSVHGDIPELANLFRTWVGAGNRVVIASDQPHRVTELVAGQDVPVLDLTRPDAKPGDVPIEVTHARLSAGFRLPGIRLNVLSDAEIFGKGERRSRPQRVTRKFKEGRPIMSLMELKEGDLVVHVTHGIGRYRGLERRTVAGIDREFLRIDYQEPDRLFVPSDQLDRVQKYIGSDDAHPTVHRLGGSEWVRTKSKVQTRVREMAKELLQLYAQRAARQGYAFGQDTVWQQEMEAAFPYTETDDQLQAIQDSKRDMETPRPMDRLVCGDVGYGKTEVAIRAAFKAVTEGKQVAVLVPTTVLAQQHYQTFSERLAAFPVKVEVLSRFRSRAEQKKSVEGVRDGSVDIIIGTHRLLSKDVVFHDLGLLIVDEEQRFGVAHKERIKQLKANVDVLTLTATPIPRTLHMSLSGIRDMSVIEDPPEGRLAVRTYCLEADEPVIREAILRELDRGGQVYYVHNRIETIYREADKLQKLAPQARIRVAHGQMSGDDLEEAMLDFYDHEYDILVCTTIIENGLDIANCNTILINNADSLGLAQLHQLRGRVGRSSRQAYCYLPYKPFKELTETAERRLSAIREFTDLGAGFRIAMRDMEIRGAGNLLGGEQHGFMVSVGFNLYIQMIEDAVKELKGELVEEQLLPSVALPINVFIPTDYIPTEGLRIAFYRKIAAVRTPEHWEQVKTEIEDRFGDPPDPVWNLMHLMQLRMNCVVAGVGNIETKGQTVTLWMARRVDKDEQKELMRTFRRAQFLPDRILLHYDGPNPLRVAENLVEALKKKGGKLAAASVQKQLQAAQAAESLSGGKGSK